MTVIITKKQSKKEIQETLNKLIQKRESKGLRKHFGLSEKNIDALDFQKEVRNEWD
ncbi:hypothetical protein [Flavobacterium sp. ZT3R18]|jgi:hypothetical protein|uniref:hypothetical protein n=1 Tax=Flavobacterium sp. ZT3R18 TaxID=2594429 RepID=UPI00163DB7A9|nr:hypothetical protein [Flavobacterium sp. ZT3R18]